MHGSGTRNGGRNAGRGGATLAELLVALVITGVIGGATVRLLTTQMRAARLETARASAAAQLRQGALILPLALRSVATQDGAITDLMEMSDSAIEMDATIGAALVCATDSAFRLDLQPLAAPAGSASAILGGLSTSVQPGDIAFFYDDAATDAAADDVWRSASIVAIGGASSASCASLPLANSSGASLVRLTLAGAPIPNTIVAGAPVRILRRVRWTLYRASDGRWYVGQRSRSATGWAGVQPAVGPFASLASNGLATALDDSTGTSRLAPSIGDRGASLRLVAPVSAPRYPTTFDSTRLYVAFRNRQ